MCTQHKHTKRDIKTQKQLEIVGVCVCVCEHIACKSQVSAFFLFGFFFCGFFWDFFVNFLEFFCGFFGFFLVFFSYIHYKSTTDLTPTNCNCRCLCQCLSSPLQKRGTFTSLSSGRLVVRSVGYQVGWLSGRLVVRSVGRQVGWS